MGIPRGWRPRTGRALQGPLPQVQRGSQGRQGGQDSQDSQESQGLLVGQDLQGNQGQGPQGLSEPPDQQDPRGRQALMVRQE